MNCNESQAQAPRLQPTSYSKVQQALGAQQALEPQQLLEAQQAQHPALRPASQSIHNTSIISMKESSINKSIDQCSASGQKYNTLQKISKYLNKSQTDLKLSGNQSISVEMPQAPEAINNEILVKLREIIHQLQKKDATQRLEISKLRRHIEELTEHNKQLLQSNQLYEEKIKKVQKNQEAASLSPYCRIPLGLPALSSSLHLAQLLLSSGDTFFSSPSRPSGGE